MPVYTIDGDPEQFRDFMRHEFDGPFVMLNMLRFAEKASYPDDHPNAGLSGKEAYDIYIQQANKTIGHLGGEMIINGTAFGYPIAPPHEKWDKIFMIRWPSRDAFIAMIKNAEYQEITHHRTAALMDSRLIAMIED